MSALSYLSVAPVSPFAGPAVQNFETRLRDYIKTLKNASNMESRITLEWEADLAKHDVEYFASEISNRLTGDVKRMLGGDQPPTVDELLQLPPVTNQDTDVGLYGLFALPRSAQAATPQPKGVAPTPSIAQPKPVAATSTPAPPFRQPSAAGSQQVKRKAGYVGSTVRAVNGLYHRVIYEHSSEKHREKESKKYFYTVLDSAAVPCELRHFILMKTTYDSGEPDDVRSLRVIIYLAELLFISWLGMFDRRSAKFAFFMKLSPWKKAGFEYFGTNQDVPLYQNFKISKESMPLTAKDLNKRKVKQAQTRREEMTQPEKDCKKEKDAIYNKLINVPRRKLSKEAAAKLSKEQGPIVKQLKKDIDAK